MYIFQSRKLREEFKFRFFGLEKSANQTTVAVATMQPARKITTAVIVTPVTKF